MSFLVCVLFQCRFVSVLQLLRFCFLRASAQSTFETESSSGWYTTGPHGPHWFQLASFLPAGIHASIFPTGRQGSTFYWESPPPWNLCLFVNSRAKLPVSPAERRFTAEFTTKPSGRFSHNSVPRASRGAARCWRCASAASCCWGCSWRRAPPPWQAQSAELARSTGSVDLENKARPLGRFRSPGALRKLIPLEPTKDQECFGKGS